jgi:radical SAM protein with 4Fe4S-binding SPASM domain
MSTTLSLPLLQNAPAEPYYTAVPRDVSIEITGRCNLRCRHCFNESGPDNSNELPLEEIEAFLDEVKSWKVRSVRISGGEPTAHRRFRDVVEACRHRGLGIGLNTNGIYAPDMLEYLKSAPIEIFFVSIDGLEANNDAIRGANTFRRAVETCRRLKAAGQKVMIGFHVGEGNRGDVPGMAALAAELGVDLKVAPLRPVGRARRELPDSLIQPRNFYAVVRQLTRLRREYPHIHIYTDFDLLDGPPSSDCAREPGRASCKAGRSLINVRSDGAINPCAFFDGQGEEFTAGNIYRESATAVWQRPETFHEFRVQRKSGACQGCGFYQGRCNGGCPAIAHAVTGHLDALDPTCFADLVEPETFVELDDPVPPLAFARFVTPPEGGAP